MSTTEPALPPYKALAAALRATTERLARELAEPSVSAPAWNDTEWAIARSAAAMQGISALLANRVHWRGPPAWNAFLAAQLEQTRLREALIDSLLARIEAAARAAGVGCVGLKGSALRRLSLYGAGERPMGDIDLLVREADVAAIDAVMRELDYVQSSVVERHTTYEPRVKTDVGALGEHVSNPVTIEIHTLVAETLPVRKVDITAQIVPARLSPGVNAYPSLAALWLHLVLHSAGNVKAHALRQIQLHDIALLSARLTHADWEALLTLARRGELWWAYPPVALAVRYHTFAIPPALMRALHRACPLLLRNLTDRQDLTEVSWSNLGVSALPGIAWARTPVEAFRYLRSRALPSDDTRKAIRAALDRLPHMQQIPWYQQSHAKRIVRWLTSRPPRVQTLMSVTAALRHPET
jgi:hypothetical protein